MEITKDLKQKWDGLYSNGDQIKIAQRAGVSTKTISNAFAKGACSDKTFIAIAEYYNEKARKINKALGNDATHNQLVAQ
jgi:hypothetical protein